MYKVRNRLCHTPIVTAVMNHEGLGKLAPTLVSIILSFLNLDEFIATINYSLHFQPIIEHDIKCGGSVIVQVLNTLIEYFETKHLCVY